MLYTQHMIEQIKSRLKIGPDTLQLVQKATGIHRMTEAESTFAFIMSTTVQPILSVKQKRNTFEM